MPTFSKKAIFIDQNIREILKLAWHIDKDSINEHTSQLGFTVDNEKELEMFLDGKTKYGTPHRLKLNDFVYQIKIDEFSEKGFNNPDIIFV